MNILVYPSHTEVAAEIYYALKNHKYFKLIGGSKYENGKGSYLFEKNVYLPDLKSIEEVGCDYIFPASDDSCLEFSDNLPNQTIGHSYVTNKVCRDKELTYEFFKDKIRVPQIIEKVFIKPKCGNGSKGTKVLFADCNELLLEYLPGKEYTIDCISQNSKLLFAGARERVTSKAGIAEMSEPVQDEKINDIASIINDNLEFNGAWFFQLKKSEQDEYVLLEIGPRISGGMSMYRMSGINFPELSIYCKIGTPVTIRNENINVSFCKFFKPVFKHNVTYDHLYVDYDDCLYLDDKINTELMCLVLQAKNEGKGVHILTRRVHGLKRSIYSFFDSVTVVPKDISKQDFIKDNSVFIDDSFAERNSITDSSVHCFGLDNFQMLCK